MDAALDLTDRSRAYSRPAGELRLCERLPFGPDVKSKAALNVLTAALARELTAAGVSIRAADPGPTKSSLTKGAGTRATIVKRRNDVGP